MEEGGPAKFLGRRKEPNQHADTGWACVRWALAGGATGSEWERWSIRVSGLPAN